MDTSSHTLDASNPNLDASNHILDTAVTIVRKFRTLTSTTTTTVKHSPVVSSQKQESDEYVIVDNDGAIDEAATALPETSEHDIPASIQSTESTESIVSTASPASPVPVSPEHAQMLLFNEFSDFAEKYPYLFRMCTNVPTDESADNFVQILPLMLRQRDKIIESSGTQMKSATEAIIEKLHDTYVAPHGIEMSPSAKKKVSGSKKTKKVPKKPPGVA